jgi:hypothetical protein
VNTTVADLHLAYFGQPPDFEGTAYYLEDPRVVTIHNATVVTGDFSLVGSVVTAALSSVAYDFKFDSAPRVGLVDRVLPEASGVDPPQRGARAASGAAAGAFMREAAAAVEASALRAEVAEARMSYEPRGKMIDRRGGRIQRRALARWRPDHLRRAGTRRRRDADHARAAREVEAPDRMERAVTDILHRVELHGTDQGREVMVRNFLPWCGEQLKQGRELVVEARLLDDDITDKQRGYLHGGVLTQISKEAAPTASTSRWKSGRSGIARRFSASRSSRASIHSP